MPQLRCAVSSPRGHFCSQVLSDRPPKGRSPVPRLEKNVVAPRRGSSRLGEYLRKEEPFMLTIGGLAVHAAGDAPQLLLRQFDFALFRCASACNAFIRASAACSFPYALGLCT